MDPSYLVMDPTDFVMGPMDLVIGPTDLVVVPKVQKVDFLIIYQVNFITEQQASYFL